ncbi:MAG TPA: cytochrome P450 [Myxococcota bacterium]|nr:cytochrome P450 [Myxococcota bacterium]
MSQPFLFNPLDEATRRNPYALYARGRSEFPVFAHEGLPLRLFSIFRHKDCQAILRDDQTWSNVFRIEETQVQSDLAALDAEFGEPPPPSMLGTDGAEHARLRSLVNKAFTPRIVQRLEPRMHEIADELIHVAIEKGTVDLVETLTYPLPVTIIAEIIGVPAGDRARFKAWSDEAVSVLGTGFFGSLDVERLKRQRRLLEQMRGYFVPLAEERKRTPKDDLLTGLVQAEHEGSQLTQDEMLSMLVLILVAGNETTTTLIGNAVLELLGHPDQLARLRADPSLLPSAIEEVLRFSSPVQFDPRRATRTVELRGHKVERDDVVLCWLGSANRDEALCEQPHRFDIRRDRTAHLAFGFGVHFCLGANLARLEAQAALGSLLQHTRSFERVDDLPLPLPLHPSPVFRGVTSLPLRLTPA